jgi:homocysteine S-methyltransferase
VLVDDARGTAALEAYFRRHVDIAVQHSCGVILEAPTWRASRDWGARIGYPVAELRRVNESATELLAGIRGQDWDAAITCGGQRMHRAVCRWLPSGRTHE